MFDIESRADFSAFAVIFSAVRFRSILGAILPLASTMAIRVGSPFNEKIIAGTTANKDAISGSSNVPIRNAHFKTIFLYSCFTTARNFRISFDSFDLPRNLFNEYVIQTWFNFFEFRNRTAAFDQATQQKL